MFQNLKVDIIYYKTNTDFEMEFNLCGCCRMRLLTDKSPDRKTALHSLARAVSRSRIIIITGGLFGDDGIINMVSSATGIPLAELDKSIYGIGGNEPIEILKGATPLVTAEGYFGGLIIESGPQTMILISENKNIRKNIMQNLIHPYVEELCAVELKEKAASVTETNNSIQNKESGVEFIDETVEESTPDEVCAAQENNKPETPAEKVADDSENQPKEEDKISEDIFEEDNTEIYIETEEENDIDADYGSDEVDVVISGGMIFESDDEEVTELLEDVEAPLIVDQAPDDSIPDEERLKIAEEYLKDFILEPENNEDKSKVSVSLNKSILILTIILLILFAILCFCMFYIPFLSGKDAGEYVRETFNILFGKA